MDMFTNPVLAKIDAMIPPQEGKVVQMMLFSLIQEHLDGKISDAYFLADLANILGVDQ